MPKQKKYFWLAPWLMITLGGVFYCYEYILRITPSIMIPELMRSFSIQATQIGVLSSFYYWGYAMGSIMVGPCIDKYGVRRVLFWAAIVCSLGTCLFAFSDSFLMAKLSRLAIGLGSAFAFIGVLKIGAMWLPPQYFGRLAGIASMLGAASGMLGQILLSHSIKHISWQHLSIYSGAIGFAIGMLLLFFLKDKPEQNDMVEDLSHQSESFKDLVKSFKEVCLKSAFWKNCIIGFTTFLPLIVFADLWGIPFLQEKYAMTRSVAAVNVSMVFLGWAFGGPSFGYLYDVIRNWRSIFFMGTAIALTCSAMVLFLPMHVYAIKVILFLFGFTASSHVLVFVSSRKMSPPHIEATTLGVTNLFMMSAGVIIQPLIGAAIDYFTPAMHYFGYSSHQVYAYQFALSVIPISLLGTLFLIRQVGRVIDEQQEEIPLPLEPQLSMLTCESWPGNRYPNRVEESPGSTGQSAR